MRLKHSSAPSRSFSGSRSPMRARSAMYFAKMSRTRAGGSVAMDPVTARSADSRHRTRYGSRPAREKDEGAAHAHWPRHELLCWSRRPREEETRGRRVRTSDMAAVGTGHQGSSQTLGTIGRANPASHSQELTGPNCLEAYKSRGELATPSSRP